MQNVGSLTLRLNFYHSLPLDDNSLTVIDVDYVEDSGVYTCVAHNNAGTSKASATITIRNPNDTDIQGNFFCPPHSEKSG